MSSTPLQQKDPTTWSSGLFDCGSDIDICFMSFFCPIIQYNNNHEGYKDYFPTNQTDKIVFCMATSFEYIFWCATCGALGLITFIPRSLLRSRIREKYEIEGSSSMDCFNSLCCSCCSLIQEAKEIKFREDIKKDSNDL